MVRFWAKTVRSGAVTWETVHPVFEHMIDVALAFDVLAHDVWRGIGAYLISVFSDETAGRRFLSVLAGLHDIGKISPGFQAKVPALVQRLERLGFSFARGHDGDHSRSSMEFLCRALESRLTPTHGNPAVVFAQAAACHHGSYLPLDEWYDELGDSKQWEEARIDHFESLCSLFRLDPNELPVPFSVPPAQWTVVAAGLISVADWIGSSLSFPVSAASSDEYVRLRRPEIRDRITEAGFRSDRQAPGKTAFGWLFGPMGPQEWIPNSTQRLLLELTADIEGPFVAIVESPTGIGKTEAALNLYAQRARVRSQGLYFALPTMATTNAMFDRIEHFLNKLFQGDEAQIRLLQSEALMHEGFRRLLARGVNGAELSARIDAARAYEWFAGSKRGLLAEHAVGTIDQIMLAAMLARHHFVRMLGLTDKIVVVDEIHAYDTYMQYIIEALLAWLRALDTPVILLSATLPDRMRRALISAYSGRPIDETLPAGPNVSVWSEAGVAAAQISDIEPRRVLLIPRELSDRTTDEFIRTAAQAVMSAAEQGGCVACIANTVGEAQQVFDIVDQELRESVPRILLHARFVRRDRSEREELIQRLFGPDGQERPKRAVVIATQVLEQSLDVDFDYLVSDLAPVDLLIQRLGRVHRHIRREPSSSRPHSTPTIEVLTPPIGEFLPRDPVTAIYEPVVLARTALALRQRAGSQLCIPGDDRALLEDVYGDNPIGDEAIAKRLEEWEQQTFGRQAADRFAAAVKSLPRPEESHSSMVPLASVLKDLDDWSTATRLGADSQLVIVMQEVRGESNDDLVAAAVRVSTPSVVAALRQIDPPDAWRDHWFLRRCVPLDSPCGEHIGGYSISYSSKLGLQIRRKEG